MHEATEAFSSLSQETRLKVFKLLLEYGRDGIVPSKIAEELEMPPNTLSFHLSHMSRAGLVTSKKWSSPRKTEHFQFDKFAILNSAGDIILSPLWG